MGNFTKKELAQFRREAREAVRKRFASKRRDVNIKITIALKKKRKKK